MFRRWRWLIVLLVLAGLVLALRVTVLRPAPVEVETAVARTGIVEETVTNSRAGTVKARLRARLSPQIGGLVVTLPHREGDRVAAGALLLKLDDSVQRASLELARENVRTASAREREACLTADLAEKEYRRGAALEREGIASVQALDTLETERDRGRAACAAARAAADQARAQVSVVDAEIALTEVRAPFAGVLAEVSTEVGEWITPAPPGVPIPPVLDLIDPSSVVISAPIDEVDSRRVKVGQPVRITVDSHRGESFPGHVSRVAAYVLDVLEQNRTVEVEAELDDPADAADMLAGTSADIEVVLASNDDALRIPASAIAEGGQVLVVEDGHLIARTVETGMSNWRWAQVVSGLDEGDRVVTARSSTEIKPGARVAVKQADER